MKSLLNLFGAAILVAMTASCTDASIAKLESIGSPHHIQIYQFGQKIVDMHSTGKVKRENTLIYFEDRSTRQYVEIELDHSSTAVISVED